MSMARAPERTRGTLPVISGPHSVAATDAARSVLRTEQIIGPVTSPCAQASIAPSRFGSPEATRTGLCFSVR